jgi:tRNA (guanine10-N2)-dimethyltransferase
MTYFFILGANPALSLAEVFTVLGSLPSYELVDKDCLLVEVTGSLDSQALIKRLGGTIKIGQASPFVGRDLLMEIKNKCQAKPGKKFSFGFSTFGKVTMSIKSLAMNLKRALQEDGLGCRWVVSKEKNLSSVVVEQTGLLKDGAEIVLIKQGERLLVGRTEVVQLFKDWSHRDYGRPERDDFSGMLPPKLARIMINLAKVEEREILADPFCGSGTVLTEGAMLGVHELIGSDVSLEAIDDTKKNLAWLRSQYDLADFHAQLFECDARNLSKILGSNSVDKVVTEPYLGPVVGTRATPANIKNLTTLYSQFLVELDKVVKPNGRVVMVWPVLVGRKVNTFLDINMGPWRMWRPLPASLVTPAINLSQRQTIVYGRAGQKVWREIVILVKK